MNFWQRVSAIARHCAQLPEAAVYFIQLVLGFPLYILLCYSQISHCSLVNQRLTITPGRNSAYSQFRLPWRPKFPRNNYI